MKHLILVILVALLAGCYTAPPEALELIDRSIAVTAGHAKDPHGEFPPLARQAFLADHDVWQKVRALVFGVEVSAEVEMRTEARARLKRIRDIETNAEGEGE